jgi:hypothetical protein
VGVEVSLAEGGVLGFGCLLEGGESDIALNKGAIGSEGEVVLLEDREFGGGEAWFGVLGDAAGHFVAFVVLSVEGPCALCVAFEPDGMDMCAAFGYSAEDEVPGSAVVTAEAVTCKGGSAAVQGGDYSQVIKDIDDGATVRGITDCCVAPENFGLGDILVADNSLASGRAAVLNGACGKRGFVVAHGAIRCGDARFVLSGGVIGDDGVGLSCCVIVCARGDRECEG